MAEIIAYGGLAVFFVLMIWFLGKGGGKGGGGSNGHDSTPGLQ